MSRVNYPGIYRPSEYKQGINCSHVIENSENVIECDIKRMPYNPQTIHGKEV